jgi:N-acetyl-anhydromuramyl-L-alanine amidase AmpD
MPSPCYSGRDPAGVRLLVVHTAEGATTIESLGNFFSNPANEVSSHAGADDTPGTIGVYVKRADCAWTQANANGVAASLEICGFAEWDAATWAAHEGILENVAGWLAEESAAFGVPLVKLTPAEAQSGAAGVCAHSDLGTWGGNHGDPGPAFPWAHVLELAGGTSSPGPPSSSSPPAPSGSPPPWPGVYLENYTEGNGTAAWQAQMVARGWDLAVDDAYGDESEGVCRVFQSEAVAEGFDPGGIDGIVGPKTWALAWTKPIT